MQNTWYIPWYISKKTVIYHIPTTGQNAMWYTMWYAMCDIPLYITPFFDIYHGIYHVIWRFGIYHSMVYTSWYKVYINMVYINLECYIPCYITLSFIVGWLSWHLWYITGPYDISQTIYHIIYTMVYNTVYIIAYIPWYISYSIYHGIYHSIYDMIYTMLYTMVYTMVYTCYMQLYDHTMVSRQQLLVERAAIAAGDIP